MDTKKIEELLEQYFNGETTLEQERWLESYFCSEKVDPTMSSYKDEFIYFRDEKRQKYQNKLRVESFEERKSESVQKPSRSYSFPRLIAVAASVSLICGVLIGRYLLIPTDNLGVELSALRTEVNIIREELILSKVNQVSVDERMVGIGYINEVSGINEALMMTLINLVKNDSNLNVKLAAIDAMIPYAEQKEVHSSLLELLSQEKNSAVQIALANALLMFDKETLREEIDVLLQNKDLMPELKEAFVTAIRI